MSEIAAYLLGQVHIEADGVPVTLPFKQAEALLYYLLVEKEVSRSRIAGLIWGESSDESRVKSSMRNAIYILRKTFGRDFIVEARKNILQINPDYTVRLDLSLLQEEYPSRLDFYSGDFLEDFYLKDNEFYNDWILGCRQLFKRTYLDQLRRCAGRAAAEQRWADCEDACLRLIRLDEFDESGYRRLIEIYRMRGEYSRAIALYAQLEKLLSEELFQTPGQELTNLVEAIKQERNNEVLEIIAQKSTITPAAAPKSAIPFYGRQQEQSLLSSVLGRFLRQDGPAISLSVMGEAGIGKTRLLEKSLEDLRSPDVQIFQTRCYRAEEGYILKPWYSIFEQMLRCFPVQDARDQTFRAAVYRVFPYLSEKDGAPMDQDEITTVSYDDSQRSITHALLQLAETRKLIFFFDDLQWADPTSISLIRDILTTGQNRHILFLFGCRDEHSSYVDSFLEDMKLARFLQVIRLERFNFADTVSLAELLLPDRFSSPETQRQLYRETEGSPFFIIETVNNIKYNGDLADITPNMRDTIRLRTMLLTPTCRTILDLLSLFFDGASFETLLELSNKEEYELIEILDTLMSRQLIREELQTDGIVFQFTHQKILEYVYGELSITKRRILHGKIALCMEGKLKNNDSDVLLYSKLMYHYRMAGNRKQYLRYNIEYVYSYLNRSHEYYPVLNGRQLPRSYAGSVDIVAADSEGMSRILREITDLVEELQGELNDEDRQGFLSDYYHMMGRYHIRKVEYEQGYGYIRQLIDANRSLDSTQCRVNMIKANRQLICIYINRYEPEKMREVIRQSFEILTEQDRPEEFAIWWRLMGLYDIMSGDVPAGIEHLNNAISIFEGSGEKESYLFNLAASYAWLGEAQRCQMHYEEARAYYDRAISICTDHFLAGGIATFYTYAGQSALDSGDLEAAEHYLSEGVDQFSKVELMWGRGIALSYYGQLHLLRGQYREAFSLLTQTERCSRRLESVYEMGVLNRIYAQIAWRMQQKDAGILRSIFSDYLQETPSVYIQRARTLLKNVYAPIEQIYLDQLEEQLGKTM